MGARKYPEIVDELGRAFEEERKAILDIDLEGVSRLLSGIDGLLVELREALEVLDPREAAGILAWAARRREENASLLRSRMGEIEARVARLRRGRRAVAAYSPPFLAGTGRAMDSEA